MYIFNTHAHVAADEAGKIKISGRSPAEYAAYSKKLGIEKVCISCLVNRSKNDNNRIVHEAMETAPEFYIGMISTAIDELTAGEIYKYYRSGFRGIKLINSKYNYNDKRYFKIYEIAQELDIPVFFHTGFLSKEYSHADLCYDRMRPIYLDNISRMFPTLKIIGAHLGNLSFVYEAIEVAVENENIYFDLSGGTIRTLSLSFFKSAFLIGAKINLESKKEILRPGLFEKFVFGSDNPDPKELLSFYNNLMTLFKIKKEVREKILGLTAKKLFKV